MCYWVENICKLRAQPCKSLPSKVEKIWEDSMDLIPSPWPSVKIQIIVKAKNAGYCQQTFENKKFVDITQQSFDLLPQVKFPGK